MTPQELADVNAILDRACAEFQAVTDKGIDQGAAIGRKYGRIEGSVLGFVVGLLVAGVIVALNR